MHKKYDTQLDAIADAFRHEVRVFEVPGQPGRSTSAYFAIGRNAAWVLKNQRDGQWPEGTVHWVWMLVNEVTRGPS